MANTKQTVTDELEQFYNEPVPVTLIKDNWKKKDDLTVTVNEPIIKLNAALK